MIILLTFDWESKTSYNSETKCGKAHQVDFVFIHQNSHSDQKSEEKFMFLEETSADTWVKAERKVGIDVLNSMNNIICWRNNFSLT